MDLASQILAYIRDHPEVGLYAYHICKHGYSKATVVARKHRSRGVKVNEHRDPGTH